MEFKDYVEDMRSSYKENNFGTVFMERVNLYSPEKIVEFGVLDGYSLMHMAQVQQVVCPNGTIDAYDLWEDYPFNRGRQKVVQRMLDDCGFDNVTLHKGSLEDWLANPTEFDLLHVDISNDGDIVERVILAVQDQIDNGSVVMFEGGSEERDQIGWMKEYQRPPIRPIIEQYGGFVIEDFPSLSIISKR